MEVDRRQIADNDEPALPGTWLVVMPTDHTDTETAAVCSTVWPTTGAGVERFTVNGATRTVFAVAKQIREVLAEVGEVSGVVSLLALSRSAGIRSSQR